MDELRKLIAEQGTAEAKCNKSEEALQESEERYRGLFENMSEGFAYCKMIFENGEPQTDKQQKTGD